MRGASPPILWDTWALANDWRAIGHARRPRDRQEDELNRSGFAEDGLV